jgi:hypothetical protein
MAGPPITVHPLTRPLFFNINTSRYHGHRIKPEFRVRRLYMKTRWIVTIFITLFVSGCLQSTLNLPPDKEKLEKIEAGTLESSVRIIAGEPDRILKSKKGYRTYYYREKVSSDCHKNLQACTPIVIEKGKVVAVGHQWTKAWKRTRKRDTTSSGGQKVKSAGSDSTAIRKKIARLEKQVKTIPTSRTVDNLDIYRYLLKLDPDNVRYKKKVAFYETRFEKEKTERVAAIKRLATTRKWQNVRLKEFKGGPPAQMAVKILGNGKFHIWLKNTGDKPFRVEAAQFFLACKKGKRYGIFSSRDFGRKLEPGAIIEGRVIFNITCTPREIIYANPGGAVVSRNIPVPK